MFVWFKKAMPFCLCLLFLCGSSIQVFAMELSEPDGQIQPETFDMPSGTESGGGVMEGSDKKSYTVTLGDCTVGEGEELGYTTVSSQFSNASPEDGYYPGELTVELAGQIVVEAGGTLYIGTLTIGGPEASPVLTGAGTIVVKKGGHLRLISAVLEPQSQGPMIIQEEGGSVELVCTSAEEGSVQWSAPLVNNLYDSPDDVWIESGTKLTEGMLPSSMWVELQEQGQENYAEVLLFWDIGGYDGRTDGELTLTGHFVDETGQQLTSLVPLTIAVRWYTPGTLVVTDTQWKGSTVPTVQLIVRELPEDVCVWGEVSFDDGVTWSRWEEDDRFVVVEAEGKGWACVFSVTEGMEGLFRVAAEDPWADEYTCWRSAAFFMSEPEDSDDSEGNRGGSTSPDTPDRVPEPEPLPGGEETEIPADTLPPSAGDQTQQEGESSGQNTQQTSEAVIQESQQAHLEHQLYPGAEAAKQQKPTDSGSSLTEEERASGSQSETEEGALSAAQADSSTTAEELSAEEPEESEAAGITGEQISDKKEVTSLSTAVQILLGAAGAAVCAAIVAAGMYWKKK